MKARVSICKRFGQWVGEAIGEKIAKEEKKGEKGVRNEVVN